MRFDNARLGSCVAKDIGLIFIVVSIRKNCGLVLQDHWLILGFSCKTFKRGLHPSEIPLEINNAKDPLEIKNTNEVAKERQIKIEVFCCNR